MPRSFGTRASMHLKNVTSRRYRLRCSPITTSSFLARWHLTTSQVTMLSDWVNAGGNLIAMRPDKKLAGLLGLTAQASTMSNAYLLVDTSGGPGVGIVDQSIQFHGTADLYTLSGATSSGNALFQCEYGNFEPGSHAEQLLERTEVRRLRLPMTWPDPSSTHGRAIRPGRVRRETEFR